jgi:hypothetical protein
VLIENAVTAGALAAQIKARETMIAAITQMASDGFVISTVRACDASGAEVSLLIDKLDAPTSAQSIAFILSVYQGQLDALNAQLAAL